MEGQLKPFSEVTYTFCEKINSSNLHILLKLIPFRGSAYIFFEKLLLLCKNFWHKIYTFSSNLHRLWKANLNLFRKSLIPFRGSAYIYFKKLLIFCKNIWHNFYSFSSNLHRLWMPNLKLFRKSVIPFVKK